ncbi:hypothetical protein DP49_2865 [Burkholderia pseudomallei]|nr:hypothetical protein DP49_2865 [Burkholderia pseudomallei]
MVFLSCRQQMMQAGISMSASWTAARRSNRMGSRRKLCSHAKLRSTPPGSYTEATAMQFTTARALCGDAGSVQWLTICRDRSHDRPA